MAKGITTETTDVVQWEEPPAQAARGRAASKDIDVLVKELQANPGRWAIVQRDVKRNVETWKRRGCEVEFRKTGLSDADVTIGTLYARWPKESPTPAE